MTRNQILTVVRFVFAEIVIGIVILATLTQGVSARE